MRLAPHSILVDFGILRKSSKLADAYLLIKKIASEETKNPNLVAATGIEPVTLGL